MSKKLFLASLVFILLTFEVKAQKPAIISSAVFKSLVGCWQGTLNYSGTMIRKPFTTTSTMVVRQIGNLNKFQFLNVYTTDPNDDKADTITIALNGQKINHDSIKSKRYTSNGNLEIITESPGFDHDNNKAAIVRQIFTIGKQLYNYKQQVQLQGQNDWLDRQDLNYIRVPCSGENR